MKSMWTLFKMGLWMLLGALIGAGSMLTLLKLDTDQMALNIQEFMNGVIQNILMIQIISALFFVGIAIYYVFKSNRLLHRLSPMDDDETVELSLDNALNKGLFINNIYVILSFLFFGFAVDMTNKWIIASIVVFLVVFVVSMLIEIKSIQIIQSKDPMKKGDPASIKFDKQWIDSCDEAERLLIFKAAYKNMIFSKYMIMFVFIVTLFSKMIFDTGNYPIVIVSMIWLFQNIHYMVVSIKLSKEKIY